MTFYNVLAALLFLGALRLLLIAFDVLNWPDVFASGCLAVIVFNDMLSTSHTVESTEKVKYTIGLMLIDLLNFMLLALATIVISPSKNLFDVPLPRLAALLGSHSFWLLLALYWLLLILWTHLAIKGSNINWGKLLFFQFSVAGLFFLQWLVQIFGLTDVAKFGQPLILIYLVLYMTVIRQQVRKKAGLGP